MGTLPQSQTTQHEIREVIAEREAAIRGRDVGPTTPLASVVRKANRFALTSPSLTFRVDVQLVQIPAKNRRGRSSPAANQTGTFLPSAVVSYSLKLVKGTRQWCSTPSHRRQCGEVTVRTLVTP